jgi:hypothetical protein
MNDFVQNLYFYQQNSFSLDSSDAQIYFRLTLRISSSYLERFLTSQPKAFPEYFEVFFSSYPSRKSFFISQNVLLDTICLFPSSYSQYSEYFRLNIYHLFEYSSKIHEYIFDGN